MAIDQGIPFAAGRVWVREIGDSDEPYWQNRRRFNVLFQGVEHDVPQCYLDDASSGITGQNPYFTSETQVNYADHLLWEAIPLDWLYTEATKPQVLVTIDGLPALCANLNCDYMYTLSGGSITS